MLYISKTLHFVHIACLHVLQDSHNKQQLFPNNTDESVFVVWVHCVFCELQMQFLNII